MDSSRVVQEYRRIHNIGEVPINGMNPSPLVLHGTNGRSYREVDTNIWMDLEGEEGIAYVGTSRHAGGVVLRPMFLNIEGIWRNAVTGRETDFTRWKSRRNSLEEQANVSAAAQASNMASQESTVMPPSATLRGDWARRCASLVSICESFSWSDQLDNVYQHISDTVATVLGCAEVYVNLFVAEGIRNVGVAYHTDGNELFRWEGYFSPDSSLNLRWMLDVTEPLVMDLEKDRIPELVESGSLDTSARCAIAFPIRSLEANTGICFALFEDMQELNQEESEFLMLVGRLLGVFVKRVRDTRNAFELLALNERRNLSKGIRDNVVTLMGSLSLNAAAASASFEDGDYDAACKDLERLEGAASKAMGILGDELSLLDIPLDETHGFIDGVQMCLARFETSWGIATELDLSGLKRNSPVKIIIGLQLTQILGECLSNVLKYAHASHVKVSLADDAHCYSMIVEDDGVGFDVNATEKKSYGIQMMKQRAKAAGGELAIFSDENGTSVCVDIPYEKSRWRG